MNKVSGEMMNKTRKEDTQGRRLSKRRIVVVVVPPVVGPAQVLSAANRLSGKKVYSIDIATSGKELTVVCNRAFAPGFYVRSTSQKSPHHISNGSGTGIRVQDQPNSDRD